MDGILITFGLGLLSGFLNAVVGGGGLIVIPALIFLGLSPHVAIATNKFGTIGVVLIACYKFMKAGKVHWPLAVGFVVIATVAGVLGAEFVLEVDSEFLMKLIGWIILLFVPVFYFKKELGVEKRETPLWMKLIGFLLYFAAMFFAASFGGGAGILVMYIITTFFGLPILETKATDVIAWFCLTASSLIVFIGSDVINFEVGYSLIAGSLIGGSIGAHLAINKGSLWIKRIFFCNIT